MKLDREHWSDFRLPSMAGMWWQQRKRNYTAIHYIDNIAHRLNFRQYAQNMVSGISYPEKVAVMNQYLFDAISGKVLSGQRKIYLKRPWLLRTQQLLPPPRHTDRQGVVEHVYFYLLSCRIMVRLCVSFVQRAGTITPGRSVFCSFRLRNYQRSSKFTNRF